MYYFAKAKTDNVRETVQQEKSGGWKWFTKEEIENAEEITENIRFYAVKALEQLSVNKR